jgi:hypothetical protein
MPVTKTREIAGATSSANRTESRVRTSSAAIVSGEDKRASLCTVGFDTRRHVAIRSRTIPSLRAQRTNAGLRGSSVHSDPTTGQPVSVGTLRPGAAVATS